MDDRRTLRASALGDAARPRMSAIMVDGFYQWLYYFSRDKARLERAFRHIFNLDVFFLAVDEAGEVIGMAACNGGGAPTVRLDRAEFRRHLGFFRGSFAHSMLKKTFVERQYPFPTPPGMGMIEFVAVEAAHRGQGVASGMLRDIFAATPWGEYVLEVADTNVPAVATYEKLGFAEFLRVPLGRVAARQSGIGSYVYMKLKRTEEGAP